MNLARRRPTPGFMLYFPGGGISGVSYDIFVYHVCLCVFFRGVFLHSTVTGACPVTTDLIMRVNVRTTTTTTSCRVLLYMAGTGTLLQLYAHALEEPCSTQQYTAAQAAYHLKCSIKKHKC